MSSLTPEHLVKARDLGLHFFPAVGQEAEAERLALAITQVITEVVEGERERCAKVANARGVIEEEAFGLDRSAQNCYRIRDAIRRGDE
jgi:hypothetical protein